MNSTSIMKLFHSPSMYMFFVFVMILLLVIFVFDDTTYIVNKKHPHTIDIQIDSKPYRNDLIPTVKYINNDNVYDNIYDKDMYLYKQTMVDDLEPSYV